MREIDKQLFMSTIKTDDSVQNLIENNANVNIVDANGLTPLMWAVELWRPSNINALLNSGADIFTKDSTGKTVLERANQYIDSPDPKPHEFVELTKECVAILENHINLISNENVQQEDVELIAAT